MTPDALVRAREILSRHPLIDGHNDLPWAMRRLAKYDFDQMDPAGALEKTHTDLPRMRGGGVGAQFWSVFVPSSLSGEAAHTATVEQIDFVHELVRRSPDQLQLALSADDVDRAFSLARIACLMGAEGGHSIACSMGALRSLYRLGVRYMTLTHNDNNPWADSATDEPGVGGLSPFGLEVVAEMNRLGMLVDISHVAETTMNAALHASASPLIFSHSSCRAVVDHPRNVPDAVLARLADNGGVCMITFVPSFVSADCRAWELSARAHVEGLGLDREDVDGRRQARRGYENVHPRPVATIADVVAHAEHVRELVGIDHVGVGGDYDGTDAMPEGLEDVSCYPALIAALLERGWSDKDCAQMAGANVLRVLREAEVVAARLQKERSPSVARIEDLDQQAAQQ